MRENFERNVIKEESKEFGHNIEIVASFRRHFDPAKDESGMSLDQLTEKGREDAKKLGQTLAEPVIKGYSSPKERAKDTIDLALSNINKSVRILNQPQSPKHQDGSEHTYIIREKRELDTVPKSVTGLFKEGLVYAKEQAAAGNQTPALDLAIQYMFDHPERAEALGAPSMREIAQDLAARLELYRQMSGRLYDNSRLRLENGTHGPKLEPLLKEIILRKEGNKIIKGFDNVSEIGGAFKPGENFEVLIKRGDKEEEKITLRLRGQEYDIDTAKLKKLSEEYQERIKREKQNKAT